MLAGKQDREDIVTKAHRLFPKVNDDRAGKEALEKEQMMMK